MLLQTSAEVLQVEEPYSMIRARFDNCSFGSSRTLNTHL